MQDSKLVRWLELCGLTGADGTADLLDAAQDDFDSQPVLRAMLDCPTKVFIRWWHGQDVSTWRLTRATGKTDWAWLVLARAANEGSESRWGGLD